MCPMCCAVCVCNVCRRHDVVGESCDWRQSSCVMVVLVAVGNTCVRCIHPCSTLLYCRPHSLSAPQYMSVLRCRHLRCCA